MITRGAIHKVQVSQKVSGEYYVLFSPNLNNHQDPEVHPCVWSSDELSLYEGVLFTNMSGESIFSDYKLRKHIHQKQYSSE